MKNLASAIATAAQVQNFLVVARSYAPWGPTDVMSLSDWQLGWAGCESFGDRDEAWENVSLGYRPIQCEGDGAVITACYVQLSILTTDDIPSDVALVDWPESISGPERRRISEILIGMVRQNGAA